MHFKTHRNTIILNFLYYACFFLSLSLAIPLDVSLSEDAPSNLLSRQVPPFSTDNIRNCPNAAAVARVQRALNDVMQLSNAATKYGTGRYYSAWFRSNPPAAATSDARIAKRYSQLAAWISSPTKDIFFDCNWQQAGCSRFTIVAYTSKGGSVIVLCQSWWTSPYSSLSSLVPPSPHEPSASLDGYVTTGSQMLHKVNLLIGLTLPYNIL